jgi:glutamate synthase (NADPH/NADH) small chain
MVIRAVGQKPATEFLRAVKGLELNKNGTVKVNERHQTGHPKYFAGGDCTNGGKEVVDAVAEGMAAARGLDAWLGSSRPTKK